MYPLWCAPRYHSMRSFGTVMMSRLQIGERGVYVTLTGPVGRPMRSSGRARAWSVSRAVKRRPSGRRASRLPECSQQCWDGHPREAETQSLMRAPAGWYRVGASLFRGGEVERRRGRAGVPRAREWAPEVGSATVGSGIFASKVSQASGGWVYPDREWPRSTVGRRTFVPERAWEHRRPVARILWRTERLCPGATLDLE